MSSINQLSEASSVSSSMQIPVYDAGNGQPRKISIAQLQDYIVDNAPTPTAPVKLPSYTVATLPAAVGNDGSLVYCTNGNAGQPCLALSNGSAWKAIVLGATVSAT